MSKRKLFEATPAYGSSLVDYRGYFFGNYYLSSIQQGIQGAHATMEIFMKYRDQDIFDGLGNNHSEFATTQANILIAWGRNHKTKIFLNGGNDRDLRDLNKFLIDGEQSGKSIFPFSAFCEDMDSLYSSMTSVGIILSSRIYEGSQILRNIEDKAKYSSAESINGVDPYLLFVREKVILKDLPDGGQLVWEYNDWEIELMRKLQTYRLAS